MGCREYSIFQDAKKLLILMGSFFFLAQFIGGPHHLVSLLMTNDNLQFTLWKKIFFKGQKSFYFFSRPISKQKFET